MGNQKDWNERDEAVSKKLEGQLKQKEWESFDKLSSQDKIKKLWSDIYELGKAYHRHLDYSYEQEEGIKSRFQRIYEFLRNAQEKDYELEELASLRSSGPADIECPKCHRRTVIQKRGSELSIEYILECISCHWEKEFRRY